MGDTAFRIPERDWKVFKDVREAALQRYCERVLGECADVLDDGNGTPHERYLKLYSLMRRRDVELERAFDSLRRSTAYLQLIAFRRLGLVSEEETRRFSDETRTRLDGWLESAPDAPPRLTPSAHVWLRGKVTATRR